MRLSKTAGGVGKTADGGVQEPGASVGKTPGRAQPPNSYERHPEPARRRRPEARVLVAELAFEVPFLDADPPGADRGAAGRQVPRLGPQDLRALPNAPMPGGCGRPRLRHMPLAVAVPNEPVVELAVIRGESTPQSTGHPGDGHIASVSHD